jgi:glycosyltransferase involved in cell wall biosynthesis
MIPFSILIPTYNRRHKLPVVLEALSRQPDITQGEIIIGIDGSTDGTEEWLANEYSNDLNRCPNLSWFRIENSGRSVIRNRLLDRARGEIIIFTQDDIISTPGWLDSHLQAHHHRQGAVVGHVTWFPEMEITPYMTWLEHGGHLFDFDGYRDGDELDFWHFYTNNLSFPRSFLDSLRFDESLPTYGWEDILLGYELVKQGKKVFFSRTASAYHWDEYREEDFSVYIQKIARSAIVAEERYPGIGIVPPPWKRTLFRSMILMGRPLWPWLPQEWRWYLQMKEVFLENITSDRSSRYFL